jgi:hypothetical protein
LPTIATTTSSKNRAISLMRNSVLGGINQILNRNRLLMMPEIQMDQ